MGRVEYTHEEDVKIVKYIKKQDAWDRVNGNAIWILMKKANVCPGRSFQSLRNRFLRQIRERLFSDFYQLIKDVKLPRHLRSCIRTATLHSKISSTTSPSKPKHTEQDFRKENVSPSGSSSPSLLVDAEESPARRKTARKVVDAEPVIIESFEQGEWIIPHCASTPTPSPKKIPGDVSRGVKRKRLFTDSHDIFLDEGNETTDTALEKPPAKQPSKDLEPEPPANVEQPQLTQPQFFSLNINNDEMSQIELPLRALPESPQVAESINKRPTTPVLRKKRRKINSSFSYQLQINKLSRQVSQVHKKYILIAKCFTDCMKETRDDQTLAVIPDVHGIAHDPKQTAGLLANMLRSLDEKKRDEVMFQIKCLTGRR